jgi:hypothetical protein
MTDLCADIGYKSIIHTGEELCGDHVDIVRHGEDSTVIVLADGLGSGVKASILSTITGKIISTMIAEGMSLRECVATIAETLPVCSERGLAYSTFTILHLIDNRMAELIQYDNPHVILIRDNKVCDYPKTEMLIDGKQIYRSSIWLKKDDIFVVISDGCPYAGVGLKLNPNWKEKDIAQFMADLSYTGYTAKVLCTMLIDECNRLYDGKPADDATACVVRIRNREPMSILFGPPADPDDCDRMMRLFFSKEGKHIICGGTTSSIAAKWLGKPLIPVKDYDQDSGIPPMSELEGVDLVTEGVVTMSRVLYYAEDYLKSNESYEVWNYGHDGASRICQLLFEEATDINFFVGRAMNPAHQNSDLPLTFNIKMNLVKDLSVCLEKMGKRVKVSYF